ncbi:MAG: short-chain dehydrogenase [Crocinitomicaceae bacterium]|nr:short-chain dehydrogenase [Crocinitomicaceae bacterium]
MDVFFITGASSGIGKAVAELALCKGHVVYGVSRRETIQHENFHQITLDLSDLEALFNWSFPEIKEKVDRIILINNAGLIGDIKRIGEASDQEIAKLFQVNVTAPAILMNKFIGQFKAEKTALTVLNVSSGAAQYPIDAWAPYCGSKAAIDHFSNTVALEQEITNGSVRILSVGPGVVDTAMQETIRTATTQDFSRADHFKELKRNNELISPQQVAEEYMWVIDNPDKIKSVVSSLRDLR